MQSMLVPITTIAVFAVAAVLAAGLFTMWRGGSPNLSQRLMRWRIGLQFVAILLIMITVYFTRT